MRLTNTAFAVQYRAMIEPNTILAEIERFLERTGMTEAHFNYMVGRKNHNTIKRLRAGGTVRLETAQKIMRFILLQEIDGYLRREKITESRLSELALGDRSIIGQICAFSPITPEIADRLLAFIHLPHPAAMVAPSDVFVGLIDEDVLDGLYPSLGE